MFTYALISYIIYTYSQKNKKCPFTVFCSKYILVVHHTKIVTRVGLTLLASHQVLLC
jgi:hypothetical protein